MSNPSDPTEWGATPSSDPTTSGAPASGTPGSGAGSYPPPTYGAPAYGPPGYGAAPPYGGGYASPYGSGYASQVDHPQGTMILVFGILGLVFCMLFGVAAWIMGNGALREIDANPSRYANRGTVQAGRIMGMISVALLVLGFAAFVLLFGVLAVGSSSSSS